MSRPEATSSSSDQFTRFESAMRHVLGVKREQIDPKKPIRKRAPKLKRRRK